MAEKQRICGNCFFHRLKDGKWVCTNYCGKYKEQTGYKGSCVNFMERNK